MNRRGTAVNHAINLPPAMGATSCIGVQTLPSEVVKRSRHISVNKMRADVVVKSPKQKAFHLARARIRCDGAERRMRWTKAASKKLRAEEIGVVKDFENLRFLMHVFRRSHAMTTRDKTQSRVLHRLQTSDNEARLDDRPPDSGGIRIGGTNKHLERVKESVFVRSPFGTTHSLKNA